MDAQVWLSASREMYRLLNLAIGRTITPYSSISLISPRPIPSSAPPPPRPTHRRRIPYPTNPPLRPSPFALYPNPFSCPTAPAKSIESAVLCCLLVSGRSMGRRVWDRHCGCDGDGDMEMRREGKGGGFKSGQEGKKETKKSNIWRKDEM